MEDISEILELGYVTDFQEFFGELIEPLLNEWALFYKENESQSFSLYKCARCEWHEPDDAYTWLPMTRHYEETHPELYTFITLAVGMSDANN